MNKILIALVLTVGLSGNVFAQWDNPMEEEKYEFISSSHAYDYEKEKWIESNVYINKAVVENYSICTKFPKWGWKKGNGKPYLFVEIVHNFFGTLSPRKREPDYAKSMMTFSSFQCEGDDEVRVFNLERNNYFAEDFASGNYIPSGNKVALIPRSFRLDKQHKDVPTPWFEIRKKIKDHVCAIPRDKLINNRSKPVKEACKHPDTDW